MPKLCPNIRFPHQQDFFPIRSVTKSSTSRFSHENLVEKFKIFGQDFVPIRTALIGAKNLYENGSNPFFCCCCFQSYGNENGPDSSSQIHLNVSQQDYKRIWGPNSFAPAIQNCICIISPKKTVYAIYCIYLIATL